MEKSHFLWIIFKTEFSYWPSHYSTSTLKYADGSLSQFSTWGVFFSLILPQVHENLQVGGNGYTYTKDTLSHPIQLAKNIGGWVCLICPRNYKG